MLKELQAISVAFKITLITGLIIRNIEFQALPPFSAAYLISDSRCTLMCYKTLVDNSDNYSPCTQDCDLMNPMQCNGHWIGALICMDVDDTQRGITLQKQFETLDRSGSACRFFCVPACMYKYYYGGGAIGNDAQLRPESTNTVTIVANSDPEGCKSFITNSAGKIITHVPEERRRANVIVLEPLAKLLKAPI